MGRAEGNAIRQWEGHPAQTIGPQVCPQSRPVVAGMAAHPPRFENKPPLLVGKYPVHVHTWIYHKVRCINEQIVRVCWWSVSDLSTLTIPSCDTRFQAISHDLMMTQCFLTTTCLWSWLLLCHGHLGL